MGVFSPIFSPWSLLGNPTQTEQHACCQPFWGLTKAREDVLCDGPPEASLHFIETQRPAVNQWVLYCHGAICEQFGWLRAALRLSPGPDDGSHVTR